LDRVQTELSVQYVDHNLVQGDFRNADDHLFLHSACRRFGVWFSRPGNGVSHPLHMERFGIPGKTLLGSDSHTPASGALGMLAIGAGGLEVALAMAGHPFHVRMPKIWGVQLSGTLPAWVSAKDVILEMLRRHGVKGGVGYIFEYFGSGLGGLSAMDRHVIANMGAELGATSTVFPSDQMVRRFLRMQERGDQWCELLADSGATYDRQDEIDLSRLEPLIACPSSPENVVPVHEVAGREIYQAYIGSSANPGLRDFAVPAMMVDGRQIDRRVSLDINPTSRQILENLVEFGFLAKLIRAGARIHQTGCNGCIGMGQAPATGRISLRTVPRNFPGRSGTREDQVYLCSPEVAAASALTGVITDPRTLSMSYPRFEEPATLHLNTTMMQAPDPADAGVPLEKGPNIKTLPDFDPLPEELEAPVLLKVEDNISTDEIMPAGMRVLPYRSNIPAISKFVFCDVDPEYVKRAEEHGRKPSVIVAGQNYGQGSSREHAAIAPRYLGLRVVIAVSFARIHWHNLVNFGILPLTFDNSEDWETIDQGDVLSMSDLHSRVSQRQPLEVTNRRTGQKLKLNQQLSERQTEVILAGSLLNVLRRSAPQKCPDPEKAKAPSRSMASAANR
jgi:aconitate hydratase